MSDSHNTKPIEPVISQSPEKSHTGRNIAAFICGGVLGFTIPTGAGIFGAMAAMGPGESFSQAGVVAGTILFGFGALVCGLFIRPAFREPRKSYFLIGLLMFCTLACLLQGLCYIAL